MKPPAAPACNHPSRNRASLWLLRMVDQDAPRNRSRDGLLLALMTVAIGVIDFHVGVFFSLEPLYLLPLILAVLWSGWGPAANVAIASFLMRYAADFAKGAHYERPYTALWNRLVSLGLYFVIIWIVNLLVTLHRDLEARVRTRTAELEKAVDELTDLQLKITEVSRRERGAIGHELHDGLGQHLTATALAAELVAERLSGRQDPVAVQARSVVGLVQDAIAQTRQIARGLLLANVSAERLASELEELVAHAREQHYLAGRFHSAGLVQLTDSTVASQLFWIAQEAVRNALRHGRPTRLEIGLEGEADWLELTVTDNGVGLNGSRNPQPGIGLRIMANRAQMIGGELTVEPAPGGGTRVRCRVPVAAETFAAV